MKKIYFSALALIVGASFTLNAQVLNPSFENWTTGNPDDWTTFNPISAAGDLTNTPATQENTSPTDGNFYIKLTSFILSNTIDATNAPNGNYGSFATQDITTTVKYASMSMDVSYDILGGDQGIIVIQAFDSNGDVVAQALEEMTGSQATLTNVSFPLSYSGDVASYSIFIVSSEAQLFGGTTPIVDGSTVSVDNITVGAAIVDPPNVSNVVASDISDNQDGTDLEVTFDVPADESNIDSYYVAVFASSVTPSMLATPGAYFTANGTPIATNGSAQSHTFTVADIYLRLNTAGTAFETALIEEGVEFKVYVYVDGATGYGSVIDVSNAITLSSTTSSIVELTKSVNVYPNPATNFVNFEIDGLENGTVTISSITGQEVVNTSFANGVEKVDVNHLNNGVYIYTVRNLNGEVIKTNKLVIRK
jgi:hypothetical protein